MTYVLFCLWGHFSLFDFEDFNSYTWEKSWTWKIHLGEDSYTQQWQHTTIQQNKTYQSLTGCSVPQAGLYIYKINKNRHNCMKLPWLLTNNVGNKNPNFCVFSTIFLQKMCFIHLFTIIASLRFNSDAVKFLLLLWFYPYFLQFSFHYNISLIQFSVYFNHHLHIA